MAAPSSQLTPDEFFKMCAEFGYQCPVVLKDGRYAAVYERGYNSVIQVNIDRYGYSDQF